MNIRGTKKKEGMNIVLIRRLARLLTCNYSFVFKSNTRLHSYLLQIVLLA